MYNIHTHVYNTFDFVTRADCSPGGVKCVSTQVRPLQPNTFTSLEVCGLHRGSRDSGDEKDIWRIMHVTSSVQLNQRQKKNTTQIYICPRKQINSAYLQKVNEGRICESPAYR